MTILRCDGVSVVRGDKRILAGVTMEVVAGRLLAIVGPNGAGKSTLMAVVAGDLTPSSGTVSLDGRPLARHDVRALARRRAFLRQRFSVSSDFRAAEIVRLGRTPHPTGGGAREDDELAARLLAEVGLTGFGARAYATLSGGEQQRVHFARVLAQLEGDAPEPKLVLLDEPSASLDPRHQHDVLSIVRARVQKGYGAVAVLHDLSLAARYADDVLVLAEGRVRCAAPVAHMDAAVLSEVFRVEVRASRGTDGESTWIVEGPRNAS